MSHRPDFTVLVEIPDLRLLVDYLREKDISQTKIDALAETLTAITGRLLESSDRLKRGIETAR